MEIHIDSIFNFFYPKHEHVDFISEGVYEIIYFVYGSGLIEFRGEKMNYKSNCVYFLKPGEIRTQTAYELTEYICIRFQSLDDFTFLPNMIYPTSSDQLLLEFKSILREFTEKQYDYFKICNLKINEVILHLTRYLAFLEKKQLDIYDLIREIDSSIQFDKTVREMADSLNYNYDYFRYKFKGITGKSPINYIIDKRIDHARELLLKDRYTCTEIALLCGFSSSAQFSNMFKREVGISPLKYKHALKGINSIKNRDFTEAFKINETKSSEI